MSQTETLTKPAMQTVVSRAYECLTGEDLLKFAKMTDRTETANAVPRLWIFLGSGGNGKSTLLSALEHAIELTPITDFSAEAFSVTDNAKLYCLHAVAKDEHLTLEKWDQITDVVHRDVIVVLNDIEIVDPDLQESANIIHFNRKF